MGHKVRVPCITLPSPRSENLGVVLSNGTGGERQMLIVMSVINSKIRTSMSKIALAKMMIMNGTYVGQPLVLQLTPWVCSDYNFIRNGDKCISAGPEPVPPNVCAGNDPDETYFGSSGYRLIPGNTCDKERGLKKDEPVKRPCTNGNDDMSLSVKLGLTCFQRNPPRVKSHIER